MDKEVKAPETISYFTFESVRATMERTIKRLWILVIILVGLLVATNVGWMIYESQFEEIEITQEAEANDNGSAIVNGDHAGATIYGESTTDHQNPTP